jgi:hypothetical protein
MSHKVSAHRRSIHDPLVDLASKPGISGPSAASVMAAAVRPAILKVMVAVGILAEPLCAACGEVAARVEVVPPGQLPARWRRWSRKHRQSFEQHRDQAQWYLMFAGVTAGNGWVGDPVSAERAHVIIEAFRRPYRFEQVHAAELYDDAGFCEPCDAAYCHRHWHLSDTGYGRCPQQHGKSLGPRHGPAG